jgi:hypothetical protein
MILLASENRTNRSISRELRTSAASVGTWRRRYVLHGLEGIRYQAPRIPRRNDRTRNVAKRILKATTSVAPPEGHRWTTRSLGEYLGVSHMQVYRVWKSHGIQIDHSPWLPRRVAPAPWVDMVGLFRSESMRAIVFGVDNSQSHSRPPGLFPSPYDESRPGPSSLIYVPAPGASELNWSLQGLGEMIPGRSVPAPAPHDIVIFLRSLERSGPPSLVFHAIVESPGSKTRHRIDAWFARHPRFVAQIVESAAEWRAAVDRFLTEWNQRRLAGSSFRGVGYLAEALARFAGRVSRGAVAFAWSLFSELQGIPLGPRRSPTGLALSSA